MQKSSTEMLGIFVLWLENKIELMYNDFKLNKRIGENFMVVRYKLADGRLSTQYEVGDTFTVIGKSCYFSTGRVVRLEGNSSSSCPCFSPDENGEVSPISWCKIVPTQETKLKYQKKSKPFTKSDLNDGMKVTLRNGAVRIVLEDRLVTYLSFSNSYIITNNLNSFTEDLIRKDDIKNLDIMKVEDRDGTVLFERVEEPTKRKMTLELTDEQIQSLRQHNII